MKSGERYRAKAFELLDRAEIENSPVLKAEFENLAAAYLRLAEQGGAQYCARCRVRVTPRREEILMGLLS